MATITTTLGTKQISIELNDIVWFKAGDKLVEARTLDGRDVIMPNRTTIKALAAKYSQEFIQVSFSQLVAVSRVVNLKYADRGGQIYLDHGLPLRVTPGFYRSVRDFVETLEARQIAQEAEPAAPQTWYARGRKVRANGGNKVPPSGLSACDRSWWLAGWNDRDIEACSRRNNGPVY